MRPSYYLIILTIFLLFSPSAKAMNYVVKNIRVDVEADNAIQARDEAMSSARRKAFNVLMKRMFPSRGAETMPKADDRSIASMVDSFEVNREKLSKNRYLASVNVAFNDNAVQIFMNRQSMFSNDVYNNTVSDPMQAVLDQQLKGAKGFGQSGLYREYSAQNKMAHMRQYKMEVHIKNIREWMDIQNRLNALGQFDIVSLRSNRAILNLGYDGDAMTLQNALDIKGLGLFNNNSITTSDVPYILELKG